MATSSPQGLDITELMNAAFETKQANDQATQGLVSNARKSEALSDANVRLQETMGESAGIIQSAKDTAALETQRNRARAATDLGTNLKESSQILTSLAATIATSYADRDAALSRIEAKRNISVLDDPLGWVNAQFEINDDIRAHNVADERLANATKYYADANSLTQTAVSTQNQIDEPITQAAVEASARATAATAALKANTERERGIVANSAGIQAALAGQKESYQIGKDVYGAQKQQQQIDIALAHLDLSRQERADRLAKRGVEDADEAQQIAWINKGGKDRLGDSYLPLVPGTASAKVALQNLSRPNTPLGQQYLNDLMSGQTAFMVDPTGQYKQISTSPAHLIGMLARDIPIKFSPAQEPVVDLLKQANNNVAAASRVPGSTIDPKNQQSYDKALNAEVNRLLDDQAKRVDSPSNVFNIPSLAELIKNPISGPRLQQLPVVQKLLAPQIAAGNNLSDPNQVFGLIADGVSKKIITYPEALGVTELFNTGVNVNIEAKQLPSLGMTPRWSYNAQVTTLQNAPFGGKEIVDLTKPDAVGRALNKYLANGYRRDLGEAFKALGPGDSPFGNQ